MPFLIYLTDYHMALFYHHYIQNEFLFLTQPTFKSASPFCHLTHPSVLPVPQLAGLPVLFWACICLFLAKYLFLPQVAQSLYYNLPISQPDHFITLLLIERFLVLQWMVLNPSVAQVRGLPTLCQHYVTVSLACLQPYPTSCLPAL